MVLASWKVLWNEFSADTFTYGSKIKYHSRDDVEFENELMPPGTVIKQWYSKTNFQMNKIEPALPLIDGEGRYQIIYSIECPMGEQPLLRLIFLDRYDEEIENVYIWNQEEYFRCPLRTYSYKLQLLNGGMSKFRFHSITIREVELEDEKTKNESKDKKTKKNSRKSKKI